MLLILGSFKHAADKLFLEDSGGPVRTFKCLNAVVLKRTDCRQVQWFYCCCCLVSADCV